MRNVMPAEAGIQSKKWRRSFHWIPAFAGMTLAFICAVSAQAAELRMDRSVCQLLSKHVPDADVAYQPGVDVQGRAVPPADLNPSPINKELERQVAIRLTNQTAKVFGIAQPTIQVNNQPVPLAEGETEIGYITLQNGQPYLNGTRLTSDQQDELAVLCIENKKR
jgi:hypothetical protein